MMTASINSKPASQKDTASLSKTTSSSYESTSPAGSKKHGSSGSSSSSSSSSRYSSTRTVTRWRVSFLVSLTVMAALLGTGFYFLLRNEETKLASAQFDAIADRALDSILEIAERKRLGTLSMASVASNANPDAEKWPFVVVHGYEKMSTRIIQTSVGREMGFCPIVRPEQVEEYEEFAYDYWYKSRYPEPFPNTTAVSPFGRGIWGVNATGQKYHDYDGETSYDSPNKILTPILHHNMGPHPALMINLHFQETRGVAIDGIIECSKQRKFAPNPEDMECGAITDMINLTSHDEQPGPGALLIQPIYPGNDPTTLAGILASSIVWDEVLYKVFSSEVSGIDCVLESDEKVFTYAVSNGKAHLKGEWGDLHENSKFGELHRRELLLTGKDHYNYASATYRLSLYATEEFVESYRTTNPAVAAFGAAMCIFLTAILFILYDFYVRKEFNARRELLEAKRKFVRFVSHEVRTPLNSVCMGLALQLEEIEAALGIEPKNGPLTRKPVVDEAHARDWLDLGQEVLLNAQSSVDVLNDLLNYDKVEMGTLSLEFSVIPIWQLIERTKNEFMLPAAAKHLEYSLEFEKGNDDPEKAMQSSSESLSQDVKDMKVVGDTIRITQVLRNLISNAVKFTKDGGSLKVGVSWSEADENVPKSSKSFVLENGTEATYPFQGNLTVAVTDSGAGMTKEQVAKLFRDGVQFNVNELQAGNGSGLGLYIAKGIVEQHGGQLSASSEGLGHGTTFTMILPLYHIPDEKHHHHRVGYDKHDSDVDSETRARELQSTYLNILVVDDAGSNRKLLSRILQNHGHSTSEAENGRDAIDKVDAAVKQGKPYDCILMDYEMPEMNGPDACREMRSRGCDSFIVGVTGNLMAEDVALFKECGANSVLGKPFRLNQLDQLWLEHGVLGSHSDDSESSETQE